MQTIVYNHNIDSEREIGAGEKAGACITTCAVKIMKYKQII